MSVEASFPSYFYGTFRRNCPWDRRMCNAGCFEKIHLQTHICLELHQLPDLVQQLQLSSEPVFFAGKYLIIGNAFFFSLIASAIIVAIAEKKNGSAEAMILTGIAIMFFFQACTTFMSYFAEAEAVKSAMFWMVGDLGKARWEDFYFVIPIVLGLVPLAIWKSWDLNIIGTGDESAKSLGNECKKIQNSHNDNFIPSCCRSCMFCWRNRVCRIDITSYLQDYHRRRQSVFNPCLRSNGWIVPDYS